MTQIVITEFMDTAAVDRLKATHSTLYDPGLADRQGEILPHLGDCHALIVRNRTKVTAELMDSAPVLKAIGRLGVGLDNIDVEAAKARGIAVYPATGANNLSVAEYVITTAMLLLRGAYTSSASVAAGNWPRNQLIGRETAGRTLGLVGFGAIARETAVKAKALGMKIVAFDPMLPPENSAWAECRRLGLDELLATADVVSLHVPLTAATHRMIDERAIGLMRKGAILINAARGGVVDEDALCAALREGRLGGAALDVFEQEPLGENTGAKFAGLPNLVLTPHIAGVTEESNVRVSELIADTILKHLAEPA